MEITFGITLFADKSARRLEHRRLTLRALEKRIKAARAETKDRLPLLKLARFGEKRSPKGSLRYDANVLSCGGIEIDYDGEEIGFAEATETLLRAGIEALLYTSPSYTPEKPRWRIIAPFSTELPPQERARMVARVNGLFNGRAAEGESFALSQAYYYGSVNGSTVETAIVPGTELDLMDALDATAIGKPERGRNKAAAGKPKASRASASGVTADWNTAEPADLDALPITDKFKALIRAEKVPPRYKDDRSRLLFAIAVGLAKAGCADTEIMGALKASPPIRAHVNEQGAPADYAARQIARAREEAALADDPRPVINYIATDPKAMAVAGETALIAAGVLLYQQNGSLVRIVKLPEASNRGGVERDAGAVVLLRATIPWLRGEMMARAKWVCPRINEDGVIELVEIALPRDVPETYLAMAGEWQVPVLRGVVEAPTLYCRGDGFALLQTPGYHAKSGLYFEPGATVFPAISERPTDEEAAAAIDRLLDLFTEFPFVPSDADDDWRPSVLPGSTPSAARSVALSAILTGLIRRDMEAAPMHAFDAAAAGTGKSYLARVISMIVTGRRAAAMPWVREVHEQRKRLLSVLMEGDAVVLLDNATEPIGGAPINVVMSEPKIKDRILGKSENGAPYTNCLFLATGNNLQFEGDFTRRVVVARMDPRMERPELREFNGNPLRDARENRGELVGCALTLILAYLAAGRPMKGEVNDIASYEDWTLIREVLMWLGEPDPAITMDQVSVDDTEKTAIRAVMDAWERCYGAEKMKLETVAKDMRATNPKNEEEEIAGAVRSGADRADNKQEKFLALRDALSSAVDNKRELTALRIGHWVASVAGRVIGERRFVRQRSMEGRTVRLDLGSPS